MRGRHLRQNNVRPLGPLPRSGSAHAGAPESSLRPPHRKRLHGDAPRPPGRAVRVRAKPRRDCAETRHPAHGVPPDEAQADHHEGLRGGRHLLWGQNYVAGRAEV